MTKFYGSIVGSPKRLAPPQQVEHGMENGSDHILVRDTIELAAAQIADAISLGVFGWESVLDPFGCDFSFDALGASTTFSIGDVGHVAALAAATATSSAGTLKATKTIDIANYYKPLWSSLGYATLAAAQAVGPQCELLATLAGGAATGTVTWQFRGQRRI